MNIPPFGINQTLLQLSLQSYQEKDRVWVRLIAGKGFDVEKDKLYPFDGYLTLSATGFSFTRLLPKSKGGGERFTVSNGYKYLLEQNFTGYGVYLVVNPGGRTDEEIERCPTLFYECDGIPKDEQWVRVTDLETDGFEPTLVIETRNSLHVYYRTIEEEKDGWRKLQQRLIQQQDSDSAIHNESRLMRLAGFYHQKKGLKPYPIALDYYSDAIYHRSQFEEFLPAWDASRWSETKDTISEEELKLRLEQARIRREQLFNSQDEFPLEICLSKDDRDLIRHGASVGKRDNSGFKLASNLIATANWLNYAGYRFHGDPRLLFEEYADRCSPPLKGSDRTRIWNSASLGNPTPSLPPEAIENCIGAWQWHQLPPDEKERRRHRYTGELDPELYRQYLQKEAEREAIEEEIENYSRHSRITNKVINLLWRKSSAKKKQAFNLRFCQNQATDEDEAKDESNKAANLSKRQLLDDLRLLDTKGFVQSLATLKNAPYRLVWQSATGAAATALPIEPATRLPTPEEWQILGNPIIEFVGRREEAWLEAIALGYVVHDRSFMGSGKSHSVPQIGNNTGKVWYLTTDHRNPTIGAICENFVDLMPRNEYGFFRNEEGKLMPVREDTIVTNIEMNGNCIRAELFNHLQASGYAPNQNTEEAINPICQTCPKANYCGLVPGLYRYERRETLRKPLIRAHLESLPRDGYNYSDDIIVVDEPSQHLQPTRVIETKEEKLLVEFERIRDLLSPDAFELLDKVRAGFSTLWQQRGGSLYGLTHTEVRSALPNISLEDLDSIIEILELNPLSLSNLFVEADALPSLSKSDYRKYCHLIKYVNAQFKTEAYWQSVDNLAKIPPNALIHILKAMRGDLGIVLRLERDTLKVTLDKRDNYSPIFNEVKGLIFLDATMQPERLKLISGVSRPILTIRSRCEQPLANLTLISINVAGLKTKNLSDTAENRVRAILTTLKDAQGKFPVIGHKILFERLNLDGYWFKDSRGVNDFAGQEFLTAIGTPFPNWGAISDQYLAITGDSQDENHYYQSLVQEEMLQLVGRQRVNRYPEKQFTIIALGTDQDWSFLAEYGAKIERRDAFEICPEAGSPWQFALHQIVETIRGTGAKTHSAIADLLGKTQQAVSKILKGAGVTLIDLIKRLDKITKSNTTTPINPLYRTGCITDQLYSRDEYFRNLFKLPPPELLSHVVELVREWGWQLYAEEFFADYPSPLQIKVLSVLSASLFDFSELELTG